MMALQYQPLPCELCELGQNSLTEDMLPEYPKPHSDEWFRALNKSNPMQAAATRQILDLAGNEEVCGVCGDDPAADYQVTPSGPPHTMRVCDDCRSIREKMHGEQFQPL